MIPAAIFVGIALVALLLARTIIVREQVQTRVTFSGPGFTCPDGFQPTQLGGMFPASGPFWENVDWWVDPATLCIFRALPGDRLKWPFVFLTDTTAQAIFIANNPRLRGPLGAPQSPLPPPPGGF